MFCVSKAMENVYENVRKEINGEQIKECLQTMLATLQSPEFIRKVGQIKTESNNDMVYLMRVLFPMVVEIQTQIVGSIGLSSTKDGLKEFLMRANQLSQDDEEIRNLFIEIKNIYLPSSVYM
ncbi:unnamed protein product [Allacma fusca]|uniref:Protein C10 n=1 Tax=Allacma fusca TaxID=39272 RepID=A0A8J2P9I4_9HEXA|nr:unnamed protein product [Allacma fusca]